MGAIPTTSKASSALLEKEHQPFGEMRNFDDSASFSYSESSKHQLIGQSPQQLARFSSGKSWLVKVGNRFKSKLAKGERSGSAYVALYVANQINNFRMALTNNEMTPEGKYISSPDYGRMINSSLNAAISTWTFFSSRAAQVPQGNNPLQRMKYALQHLDKSQVQARDLLSMSGGLTSMLEHFLKGFKVSQQLQNRKLVQAGGKASEVIYDKSRLTQGVLSIVAMSINIYALFGPEAAKKQRKETEKLEEDTHRISNFELRPFKESVSLSVKDRIKESIKALSRFFKNNPMLAMNSLISVATAFALGVEGQLKRNEQKRMFGKVEDFSQKVEVEIGKKDVKTVNASEQLFNSMFGMKKFNGKIREIAGDSVPVDGSAKDFFNVLCNDSARMSQLNDLIPEGKKALNEAGTRALKSSAMGLLLNGWGQKFRSDQVMMDDNISLGTAR